MERQKDVIVVGGGIIGFSTAYYLAQQGRSVMVIEKDDIGSGSSHGNAGLIANGFAIPIPAPGVLSQGLKWLLDPTSPFYIKPRLDFDLISWLWKFRGACNKDQVRHAIPVLLSLGKGSFDLFDELFDNEDVDFGYEQKGRLILFTSQESFEKWDADIALIREFGVDVSLLDSEGVRRIEPNVLPAVQHGIYCESYAHVNPAYFVGEMARLAKDLGVEIKTGTLVTGFETAGNQVSDVLTTEEAFTPNQVVLAAGAWSPLVAQSLNVKLPIQPAKGYSLTYTRPLNSPQLPLSLAEGKVAVTPMGSLLRFTSTLELAGFDPSINQRRLGAIRHSVKEYLPGMEDLQDEVAWSGYRPATPDDLPIIGQSGKYDNFILATGHGTLGLTHGLVTGKLVAQIISGETPMMDLTPLSPDRF